MAAHLETESDVLNAVNRAFDDIKAVSAAGVGQTNRERLWDAIEDIEGRIKRLHDLMRDLDDVRNAMAPVAVDLALAA